MKEFAPEKSVVSFSTTDSSLVLKEVQFQEIAGRQFVVGVVPNGATNNDWLAGLRAGVAWEEVTDYVVFSSHNEYITQLRQSGDTEI